MSVLGIEALTRDRINPAGVIHEHNDVDYVVERRALSQQLRGNLFPDDFGLAEGVPRKLDRTVFA